MTERYTDLGGQPQPVSEQGAAFLAALPSRARERFHTTATAGTHLRKAIANGWTPADLAAECSRDLGTASNTGAIINHRLQQCAGITPEKKLDRFVQPKPWCGQCSDPAARWRLDTDTAIRCGCWTSPKESA